MQTFIIGRDATNQIVLNDAKISRRHAQLIVAENGQVMIKDLESVNGTFVNGNRITESHLKPGDVVKCGPVFLNWSQYIQNVPEHGQVNLVSAANKAQEWNNVFLSFIKPFLATFDTGSFFRRVFGWIYIAIAILNILSPFYILFKAIDSGIFRAEGKYVLTFLLLWIVIALLSWFGFQLWWNRRDKVNLSSYSGAEFVATPVLSHFIQTIGEWYGVIVGVLGFLVGLLSLFFSGGYDFMNQGFDGSYIPIPFISKTGWQYIFLGPIIGFLIVFLFRCLSEAIKALSVIANNTKVSK